ncbi:hypothetical protein GJAV_G00044070 [Gymnothorax javanicus]|nr:hypothetical protein GJAV_G00044070 [Gymnothorax javanicus]
MLTLGKLKILDSSSSLPVEFQKLYVPSSASLRVDLPNVTGPFSFRIYHRRIKAGFLWLHFTIGIISTVAVTLFLDRHVSCAP